MQYPRQSAVDISDEKKKDSRLLPLTEQRRQFIDIAKGLGIILVVIGHIPLLNESKSIAYFIIFSFHMPLFFILSGMVNNPQNSFVTLIKKRTSSLLFPYVFTLTIWMFFLLTQSVIIHTNFNLVFYLKTVVYSTGIRLHLSILWFLTALFVTHICFKAIDLLLLKKISELPLRLCIMTILLLTGVIFIRKTWFIQVPFLPMRGFFKDGIPGLPWSIDLVLITTFFFYLGNEFKHYIIDDEIPCWLFAFNLVLFFGLNLVCNFRLDLNLRIYEHVLINTAEAIAGTITVLYLSKKLESYDKHRIVRNISFLGRTSLIILIFHRPFQMLAQRLLSLLQAVPMSGSLILNFIFGLMGPLLLYKLLIRRIPALKIFYPVR